MWNPPKSESPLPSASRRSHDTWRGTIASSSPSSPGGPPQARGGGGAASSSSSEIHHGHLLLELRGIELLLRRALPSVTAPPLSLPAASFPPRPQAVFLPMLSLSLAGAAGSGPPRHVARSGARLLLRYNAAPCSARRCGPKNAIRCRISG
nr:unnamed protein product [Digitaria exilis]